MTKCNSVKLLIGWLKDQAKKDIFPRTHDLHLTDWEVRELLAELLAEFDPPLFAPDYSWGSVHKSNWEDLDARSRERD